MLLIILFRVINAKSCVQLETQWTGRVNASLNDCVQPLCCWRRRCVMSSQPMLSINPHQYAESIKVDLNEWSAFICAEQRISRVPRSLPSPSPNIASLHNLWKWQGVGGEEKKRGEMRRGADVEIMSTFSKYFCTAWPAVVFSGCCHTKAAAVCGYESRCNYDWLSNDV